uniref:Uncharacterized protein n=1 Tax=Romanomermis culicivorax TaxID=13658 RepID=A0A915I4W2_ROMCU
MNGKRDFKKWLVDNFNFTNTDLNEKEKSMIVGILVKYPNLHAINKADAGHTLLVEHTIDTQDCSKPAMPPLFHTTPKEKEIIQEEIGQAYCPSGSRDTSGSQGRYLAIVLANSNSCLACKSQDVKKFILAASLGIVARTLFNKFQMVDGKCGYAISSQSAL